MSNELEIKSPTHAALLVALATGAGAVGGWLVSAALIGAIAGFAAGVAIVVRHWPKRGG
jgi:H+/Cl- antiporter ClcA